MDAALNKSSRKSWQFEYPTIDDRLNMGREADKGWLLSVLKTSPWILPASYLLSFVSPSTSSPLWGIPPSLIVESLPISRKNNIRKRKIPIKVTAVNEIIIRLRLFNSTGSATLGCLSASTSLADTDADKLWQSLAVDSIIMSEALLYAVTLLLL